MFKAILKDLDQSNETYNINTTFYTRPISRLVDADFERLQDNFGRPFWFLKMPSKIIVYSQHLKGKQVYNSGADPC